MIKYLKGHSIFNGRDKNGREHFTAMLVCDTAAELTGVTELDGAVLDFGSLALVAKEGEVCTFDSEGKWHTSDGTEVTADE